MEELKELTSEELKNLILVHSEYRHEDNGEVVTLWSNYKIYKRDEWKLICDLTEALKPNFWREESISWEYVKSTIKIIEDPNRIKGFHLAFGLELSNSDYDIFWDIESTVGSYKERFDSDLKNMQVYNEKLIHLLKEVVRVINILNPLLPENEDFREVKKEAEKKI